MHEGPTPGTPGTSETAAGGREEAESALRASEARFRALVTANADVIFHTSRDWGELRQLDERGFLADTSELSADWLARSIHPDDLPRMMAAINESVRTSGSFELEHRVLRADGTIGWTVSRAVPVLGPDGEVTEWVGTATDVTARQQAVDALRESEGRLRLALDVAQLGTWSWDPNGNVGTLDSRGAEIVGLPAGQLGDVWAAQVAAIHPEDLAQTLSAVEAGVGSVEPFSLDYRVVRADAAERHVASRARAELDANGNLVRLVGTNRDATAERVAAAERQRLLADTERARAAAEDANRAKSEFLAVMSHELRTPLNAIGGYAELIAMGIRGPVTPAQVDDLRRIQASQRHLLGLINEVLNYAQLETGSVQYDLTTVCVRDAFAAAEPLVAPQARAKDLVLRMTACTPDILVRADTEKLRQILVNLLSNAVKFTDRGGRVEMACAEVGEQAQFTVRDSGVGIAADQCERIFLPFVQVQSELTRTAEGTGLGLAISRDLARGMGGDLTVASTPGVGSIFTLTLPLA